MLAEHFRYLDDLRQSGITNMWGAARYLANARDLSLTEADKVLVVWMETFDRDTTPEARALLVQNMKAQP